MRPGVGHPGAQDRNGPRRDRRPPGAGTRGRTPLVWLATAWVWMLPLLRGAALEEPDVLFHEANRLYEKGSYREAVDAYEKLTRQGVESANLHFNLANAAFQAGRAGLAAAHWHQALSLRPRDPDTTANLAYARLNGTLGPSRPSSLGQQITAPLNLNEWSAIAAISIWSLAGLLVAGIREPRLKATLAGYRLAACIATLGSSALLATACWHRLHRPSAVVVEKSVEARFSPLTESPVAFNLGAGSEIRVVQRHLAWYQVEAPGQSRAAWIPATNLFVIR